MLASHDFRLIKRELYQFFYPHICSRRSNCWMPRSVLVRKTQPRPCPPVWKLWGRVSGSGANWKWWKWNNNYGWCHSWHGSDTTLSKYIYFRNNSQQDFWWKRQFSNEINQHSFKNCWLPIGLGSRFYANHSLCSKLSDPISCLVDEGISSLSNGGGTRGVPMWSEGRPPASCGKLPP